MTLLIYYVVLMLIGDAIAIGVGLWVEKYSPSASMPVFLVLYFSFLWVAWVLAVRVSEPRRSAEVAALRDRPAE